MRAFFFLVTVIPGAAFAQPEAPEPVCVKAAIVPGFERFGTPAAGPMAIGKAKAVTLRPETTPPPIVGGRPFKPGSYRGEVTSDLRIATAGRYRVAVSQKAWLAVQQAGGEVESVAHTHGPACSGIAKIVSFDLQPGRYAVILSEAAEPAVTVMVAKD